jgi:hypothetical protein
MRMNPYDRLLAETIPTRPPPLTPTPRRYPAGHHWTAAEQDRHWNELCAAVGSTRELRPHLRVVNAA